MAREILLTTNDKGLESPLFPSLLRHIGEHCDQVTIPGKDWAVLTSDRLASLAYWIVIGGDGTLNRAINALMQLPPESRCRICYLPFGTGNDFARTLQLEGKDTLTLLKEAMAPEAFYPFVSVGQCNDDYFINMASGGIFATVTPETSGALKSIAGSWSYFLHGLGKVMERETILVRLNLSESKPYLGFFVANARFAGGGIQIAPGATPFRPSLDYLLVPDMPTTSLVALALELQKETPDISTYEVKTGRLEELDFQFDREVPINLDGEQVKVNRAKFFVHADALRVFVPKEWR